MLEFKPKDIIASITLVGIFALKFAGKDGQLDVAAALILGYYFAKRANGIDKGL